jgi:uncharacterized surface protein with fasciclin (FAS1) repeats
MKRTLLLFVLAVLALVLTACPASETDETPEPTLKTIADTAAGNPDFSILVEALTKAGLVDTFKGTDKYTVFAPTNAAFSALLTELNVTKEQLLALPNLGDILKYHVVSGEEKAASLTDGQELATLLTPEIVTVGIADGKVSLTDARGRISNVTAPDVAASNGVIHGIDKVLLPPAPPPAPASTTYTLNEVDESGVSGTATFTKVSDTETEVAIALTGTPEDGVHPAHIHVGSNPPGGGIHIDLGTVDGTSGEGVKIVTETDAGDPITYEDLIAYDGYINVHLSATQLNVVVATGETGAVATPALKAHKH